MAIGLIQSSTTSTSILQSSSSSQQQSKATTIIMINPRNSVLRIRVKYLLLAIIIIFMIISLIGMAYLPELKITSKQVYLQYLKSADNSLGPQLLGIIPPPSSNDNDIYGGIVNDDGRQQSQQTAMLPPPPRGRFEDEKRLRKKIEQHFNLSQQDAVIPKPNIQQALPSKIINSNSMNDDNDQNLSDHYVRDHNQNVHRYDPIRRQSNWTIIHLPNGEDSDQEIRRRREKIKQMMIIAWDSYKKYAWGENELKPLSKKGHAPGVFGKTKLGKW